MLNWCLGLDITAIIETVCLVKEDFDNEMPALEGCSDSEASDDEMPPLIEGSDREASADDSMDNELESIDNNWLQAEIHFLPSQ